MSKRLLVLLFAGSATLTGATVAGAPDWVAHASHAGFDQAPVGQSRFDELFRSANGEYRIPYPFEDLLIQLESLVDNGRDSGVRQVLIPLGRSLQRDAAAPNFFRYPRVVAALQGEPRAAADKTQNVLEYRLFIAHQPASQSLEVISYNDAAGRFEFQVVEDYREGNPGPVRQANRAMCLSCHQNAGPIFSTRPWSETNFDFRIARRLSERQPQRYDSFVTALSSDADAIDLLTDRANYLAAAQLVWQRGCSRAACRAAVLRAVLQYRLSGESGFDREHKIYREDYLEDLQRNWDRIWPQGLALASSRIPDRVPLGGNPPTRSEDPLTLRPPHAFWNRFDTVLADGIVFRLAGFLTQSDIRRIDRYLVQSDSGAARPERILASPCRLAQVGIETRLLECSSENAGDAPRATIELDYRDAEVQSLHFLSLRLPGDPGILQPSVSTMTHLPGGVAVELQNRGDISMRLTNGERLQSMQLYWQDADLRDELRIELTLVSEFDRIDTALRSMLQDGAVASLDARPFRRHAVLTDLGKAIDISLVPPLPEVIEKPATQHDGFVSDEKSESVSGDLFLLQAHCGQCHSANTRQPPGFLAGPDVNHRIVQCAPRILARLLAWQRSGQDQVVPMPPPATVKPDWHEGEHYPRLITALQNLVKETPNRRTVDAASANYHALDSCLADG